VTLSRKRFAFGVPLLATMLVLLLGWWSNRAVKQTLDASLQAELQSGLNASVTALEIWINTQIRLASVLADDPALHAAVTNLLTEPGPGTRNRRLQENSPAAADFRRLLDERIRSSGFGVVQLLSTNLEILATSSRGRLRLGSRVEAEHAAQVQEVLETGRPVLVTPFKAGFRRPPGLPPGPGAGPGGEGPRRRPTEGRPEDRADRPGRGSDSRPERPGGPRRPDFNLMEVLVPIRDTSQKVLAVAAFVLRPDEEFTKVLSVARRGDSGETLAFDPAGRLISESRFNEQLIRLGRLTNQPGTGSALNLELTDPGIDLSAGASPGTAASATSLTPMVARAVAGDSGVSVIPERDYRGVPVVGAWRWLPDRNFGVATKLDATEAFRPLYVLRSIFIVLVLLIALVTGATLVTTYWSLVWRGRFDAARLKALQLGQYTLQEKIGSGGMGVVYRARHALLRRETAIKLLLPEHADARLIQQFEREVQLTCGLSHPNTIQIYDYGHTADGIFYYVMELLRGLTLQELVERFGAQPEERVIHLLTQICGSLQEAHAAGLIHRDIKPGNLVLCERGGRADTLKVLDFGLVRRFREPTVPAGTNTDFHVEGTPLYMAPETIHHPDAGDPRSDLYAVGAVAYVLLTGHPVFAGETTAAILEQHRTATPRPLRDLVNPPPSAALEALVLSCLEKVPARRPQSAEELLRALRLCPRASDWTLARRTAWWSRYVGTAQPASTTSTPISPNTLKIDVGSRLI